MKNYDEFIEGLKEEMEVPKMVNKKFENTLKNLSDMPKDTKKKRNWIAVASVAAGFLFVVGTFIAEPTMAAKVPILGNIFSWVENDLTFSGEYKDKIDVLQTESAESTEKTRSGVFTDKNNGVEITASEVYCDGYSVFLTLKICTEKGGLSKIPSHYTTRFDKNTAQMLYAEGKWNIGQGIETVQNGILEGKAVDDNTFIGMLKLDVMDAKNGDMLCLDLSSLAYENDMVSDEFDYRINGNWKLSIPYQVDTKQVKEITVGKKNKDGFGISKLLLSPYQLVVYTEAPYTKVSPKEFTKKEFEKKWGKKNEEIVANGEEAVTYEEFLEEKHYEYNELAVFNQNGEALELYGSDNSNNEEVSVFAVKGMDISKFHIFMGTEPFEFIKATNMTSVESKSILSASVEVNKKNREK